MSPFQIFVIVVLLFLLVHVVVRLATWLSEGLDELLAMHSPPPRVLTCIGCGCSDHERCTDDDQQPCRWLATDECDKSGVCSHCGHFLPTFMDSRPPKLEVMPF